jgi:hypothetical protein
VEPPRPGADGESLFGVLPHHVRRAVQPPRDRFRVDRIVQRRDRLSPPSVMRISLQIVQSLSHLRILAPSPGGRFPMSGCGLGRRVAAVLAFPPRSRARIVADARRLFCHGPHPWPGVSDRGGRRKRRPPPFSILRELPGRLMAVEAGDLGFTKQAQAGRQVAVRAPVTRLTGVVGDWLAPVPEPPDPSVCRSPPRGQRPRLGVVVIVVVISSASVWGAGLGRRMEKLAP